MSSAVGKNVKRKRLNGAQTSKQQRAVKPNSARTEGGKGKRRRKARLDEEIESESEIESDEAGKQKGEPSSDEEDLETAEEKKLRKTKEYLELLKQEEAAKRDGEQATHDEISERLHMDDLAQAGKLHKLVADKYECPDPLSIKRLRRRGLPITCAAVAPDGKTVFSSSKDGAIVKWSVVQGKALHVIAGGRKGTESTHVGHTCCVCCLALSSDGKFLASGDQNKLIHVWDPQTMRLLHTFKGHRAGVMALAFRRNSHQLFSASADHTVKLWDLDEMAYVDTLYGHEQEVVGVDSLTREQAVTIGRDRLAHIFKVPEESALKFAKHSQMDSVAMINESCFVTGDEENSLCLWSKLKKKPVYTVKHAHCGSAQQTGESSQDAMWISAVASLPYTDLLASGSRDGYVRLWKCCDSRASQTPHSMMPQSLKPLFSVAVPGFVNSLEFTANGDALVAAVGQEHRLGRWWRLKEAKNAVYVIPLTKRSL